MEAYFQNMVEELRQMRRNLHKIPELGLKEYKTSAYIPHYAWCLVQELYLLSSIHFQDGQKVE